MCNNLEFYSLDEIKKQQIKIDWLINLYKNNKISKINCVNLITSLFHNKFDKYEEK